MKFAIKPASLSLRGAALVAACVLVLAFLLPAGVQGQEAGKSATGTGKPLKCTDPLPGLEAPNAPHGLFVILFPGARVNVSAAAHLMHTSAVCGANVYIPWRDVDSGPSAKSQYDWSSIDRQIAPWVHNGKQVNLIIWATGYGARANATPDYVFAKVPAVTCPSFGHTPVFFDRGFMDAYQSFMSAVVKKYGSDPSIGYIRFGLGAGGEIFPACMYKMMDVGWTKAVWKKYLFDMLDYEKSLNSPKQLAVGLNAFGNPPDIAFAAEIGEHAVKNGIAIGNQGLSVMDAKNDAAGKPCMADWCGIFRRNRGKVPFVLQTMGETRPDGSGEIGSMVDILPFALSQHVQIFEIYASDFLVAYDPSDPNYGRHHEEYQKAFESVARVLGGS
jgi:hypothetical protein